MVVVNQWKWVNQFQPQTLYMATILCYVDAVSGLIFGVIATSGGNQSALRTADALSRETQGLVGSELEALILHGSLTSGDFVVDQSDIDLLAVVRRPLANDAKVMLGEAIANLGQEHSIGLD